MWHVITTTAFHYLQGLIRWYKGGQALRVVVQIVEIGWPMAQSSSIVRQHLHVTEACMFVLGGN